MPSCYPIRLVAGTLMHGMPVSLSVDLAVTDRQADCLTN